MKITDLPSWHSLQDHFKRVRHLHMRDLFANDPHRFEHFSFEACGLFLDYSKNRIVAESMHLLIDFANEGNLPKKIDDLFRGEPVNFTEKRAAMHTALRNITESPVVVDGYDVMRDILSTLEKVREITIKLRSGTWRGARGDVITDVVNIGIGGSDLGAVFTCNALKPYAIDTIRLHFLSNIDAEHFNDLISKIDIYKTVFIISSKSFSTLETLAHAQAIKTHYKHDDEIRQHFLAVTANCSEAQNFGIAIENILPIWDWVGGRYSIWSAIGLPVAISIGFENFQEFLRGAFDMDQHFRYARFDRNIPVILALVSIWYSNFFGCQTQAIIPYSHRLRHLPSYLMQLVMESNGKSLTREGTYVSYQTSPIIWGEVGCNGQHAFHQLLHQGTHLVPVDFIAITQGQPDSLRHHEILIASCFSQSQALMVGTLDDGSSNDVFEHHNGNQPSNTLLLQRLTPSSLGALIAMYEHKTYVQSCLWDINAFDQYGVTLGKQLSLSLLETLSAQVETERFDNSTRGLVTRYLQTKT